MVEISVCLDRHVARRAVGSCRRAKDARRWIKPETKRPARSVTVTCFVAFIKRVCAGDLARIETTGQGVAGVRVAVVREAHFRILAV